MVSGKWYTEFVATAGGPSVGIWIPIVSPSAAFYSSPNTNYRYNTGGGLYNSAGSIIQSYSTWTTGDVIGVALDLDNGKVFFSKNGIWQGSSNPTSGTNPAVTGLTGTWTFGGGCSPGNVFVANFGQRPFAYAAPSGFKALCDTNIPEGTITTSGTFTGNANADGPFVYLNGVPTAMTINSNAVTFATHADKLANGFKVRSSSGSYNTAGSNTFSITTTGAKFKYARAQPNP
jgi:hypothetical protein